MKYSIMEFAVNYGVVNVCLVMYALRNGLTVYHLNKFDKSDFFQNLLRFQVKFLKFVSSLITNIKCL
jgi:hypothetical protein